MHLGLLVLSSHVIFNNYYFHLSQDCILTLSFHSHFLFYRTPNLGQNGEKGHLGKFESTSQFSAADIADGLVEVRPRLN